RRMAMIEQLLIQLQGAGELPAIDRELEQLASRAPKHKGIVLMQRASGFVSVCETPRFSFGDTR
ncbi:hypothetical protein, partial [Moorena sp. SIO2C4]|uniref:hypothetical protein n=1 Tax=Moorena sp. SIO2C4 TaxID=2607824 RepID=UPI00257C04D4